MRLQQIAAILLALAVCLPTSPALGAPVDDVRVSVSPTRIRLVLDSKEPIAYVDETRGSILALRLPESASRRMQPDVQDSFIRRAVLQPTGRTSSELRIFMGRNTDYRVYQLAEPDRLVVDIFRTNVVTESRQLARGVNYTYLQDDIDGRQIQAYVLSVDQDAAYELRPFSAAGTYNGRGYLSRQAAALRLLAAVNASYFDTDGWVIGTTKDRGRILSAETAPRSAYVDDGHSRMIVKDVAYTGRIIMPDGAELYVKGMNRRRIADDLVLFNEYYGRSTGTNMYGREVKIKNGRVVAVSTQGNMSVEAGTFVVSGHGVNAEALSGLRVGDRVALEETLGVPEADAAQVVVGAGPLLLENGRVQVRSEEERIAPDIARGRAPRTAIGVSRHGSVVLLVVDGRSRSSAGVTLTELAQFMLRLGVRDAVNLDGGGSSEMIINRKIVNKPSDGRERAVSMGLGLFAKK